ncbi:MAG: hypothetical protein NTW21_15415 [Verrucomicrobia bacterium]|nr:hypothetical protein [Verrucomicrobiota bacterium]
MKASTPDHVKSRIAAPSMWSAATILAIALCALLGMARAETDLAKAFVTPPDEAKPWVNMFWIGRITAADITQHLEELKAKGAGGANLIDLNAMADAPYMSDNWRNE